MPEEDKKFSSFLALDFSKSSLHLQAKDRA